MNQLDYIERRIRDLFETSSSILTGSDETSLLIHRLCESLQSYFSETESQATSRNPDFHFFLNPTTFQQWKLQPDWKTVLVEIMTTTAAEFGLHFVTPPRFTVTERNSISKNEVVISVSQTVEPAGETGAIPLDTNTISVDEDENSYRHSCLILQDDQVVPLTRSVINIGRKGDNQIVINDLRISRTHAQIRRVQEKFVIFDVGSTGGTFVNSERINERLLRSGDVISLAGYTMIYTEDQLVMEEKHRDETAELKTQSHKENN